MASTTSQPQQNLASTSPPSSSPLPQLSQRDAQSLRGAIGLGLVLTMPILMILPPRRLNGITLLQMGMFGFGANELLDYRTGQGLLWWAGKPYRWARGVDDSEIVNQRLQARLNTRRQRKEEEVKRRIAEEAQDAASQTSDTNVGSLNRVEVPKLARKTRWVGREG